MKSSKIKTEGLTENQLSNICDIIGCNRDSVTSAMHYCYFPASPYLCDRIHYELFNGNVEFHIECEADKLREYISRNNGLRRREPNAKNSYILSSKVDGASVEKEFAKLKSCVQESLEKYLSELKNEYDGKNNVFLSKKEEIQNLFPKHLNFFEMLSNNKTDGGLGGISENDHTRILLAILKTGSTSLPVLASFNEEFGIDVKIANTKREDIVFNKGYYDSKGSNFIDGLVFKRNEYAIIIENKVCGAGDQPKQIERYIRALNEQENICLDNIWVVYLTKDGTLHDDGRPTEDSYNEESEYNIGNRLICINYHDDVLPWLKDKVLPMIKYSHASMGEGTECYIDYLEQLFQEDSVSKILTESIRTWVFENLEIAKQPVVNQYRTLLKHVKILSTTNLYDEYRETLHNYMREIVKPIYAEFERATIEYFKNKGKAVTMNNKLSSGYIQIIGAGWDRHVHFEWWPKKFAPLFFFGNNINLPLCFHFEGRYKGKCSIKQYDVMLKEKSMAQMMSNGEFEEWLYSAYDNAKVIENWEILETIAMGASQVSV